MLHAGIVVGVMYGLACHQNAPESDAEIEPVFFEILEESVIASAAQSQPKVSEPEPAEPTDPVDPAEPTEPTAPAESPPAEQEVAPETESENILQALENTVRTNSHDLVLPEEEFDVKKEEEGGAEENENMVRTKFSEDDKVVESVRQDDGNNEKNNEIVMENGVVETGADVQQAKVVSAPMALNRIVPIYPRSARRRGQEGVVTLEITVSDSGAVTKADVIGSSGHSNLDHAAVSAVNTARFAPATEDGVRIEGRLRLTFEFKLR